MSEELKKIAKECWQEALDICDRCPTLVAGPFLVLGVFACVVLLLYIVAFVQGVWIDAIPVVIVWRMIFPHLLNLLMIIAVSFGIAIPVILRNLARDPDYWKKSTPP